MARQRKRRAGGLESESRATKRQRTVPLEPRVAKEGQPASKKATKTGQTATEASKTDKAAKKASKTDKTVSTTSPAPTTTAQTAPVHTASTHTPPSVQHALLARYYPRVETLRTYLLAQLPPTSRLRRKKLRLVGHRPGTAAHPVDAALSHLLDTALVCLGEQTGEQTGDRAEDTQQRQRLRATFSQGRRADADESYGTVSDEGGQSMQGEIVDFVVWLLFQRSKRTRFGFPDHVLCHGFQQSRPFVPDDEAEPVVAPPPPCTVPGLFLNRANPHAQTLKASPWPELLALLGASGEAIMTDLLVDATVFVRVDAGHDNYVQLTGRPGGEVGGRTAPLGEVGSKPTTTTTTVLSPADISFVRSRMLYARPDSTKTGAVHFGLKRIHVLNRYPYQKCPTDANATAEQANRDSTVHILMYMFPRQFGLHSVFTSRVDRATTTHRFQDYTLREDEIAARLRAQQQQHHHRTRPAVPRRLRGLPLRLVEQLRIRHARCAYHALLEHYCPVPVATANVVDNDVIAQATPVAHVSAFCQAVLSRLVPDAFWGAGAVQVANKAAFLHKVDAFLRLRRYETLSLHGLLQGLKVVGVPWLGSSEGKLCRTDLDKRRALWAEFLYYVVDSLLVPLLRTNFYITESGLHRNRLFYFRHDVWRRLAEPALATLRADMFEEVGGEDVRRALAGAAGTVGQVRLLPKQAALRPIVNLRRRAAAAATKRGGTKQLASSTNKVLEGVAAMLRYEMSTHPDRLGASMSSVNTIYERLKPFKQRLAATAGHGGGLPRLFLAKVDVKAAFDTIPQDAMVALLRTLPSAARYHLDRHFEMSACGGGGTTAERQWKTDARADDDGAAFAEWVARAAAPQRRSTVFVDAAFRRTVHHAALVDRAAAHIQHNLVQLGRRYYRQRRGIPQGSVLSSALCNYFYADLEREELFFLREGDEDDCLLLRLIDDFLLVTTNRDKAARFVETMHAGCPRYGVAVNPRKTLVNFGLQVDGQAVPRLDGELFPYCGTFIHCGTLALQRDRETKSQVVHDTITVEHARRPGVHFQRKTLSYFQFQAQSMFFDAAHNSRRTTLHNLHAAFAETAAKMWAYARSLPRTQRPRPALVTATIQQLGELAYALLSGTTRTRRWPDYRFGVTKVEMRGVLLSAFLSVLGRKQSAYAAEIAWLRAGLDELRTRHGLRLPASIEFI